MSNTRLSEWDIDTLIKIAVHSDDFGISCGGTAHRLRRERPDVGIHVIQATPSYRGVTDEFLELHELDARAALTAWLCADGMVSSADDDVLWELVCDSLRDECRWYGSGRGEQFQNLLKTAIRWREAVLEAEILGLDPSTGFHFLALGETYAKGERIHHESHKLRDLLLRLSAGRARVAVVVPHPADRHPTHSLISWLVTSMVDACEARVELLYCATPWMPDLPDPNRVVCFGHRDIGAKLDAMRVHESQIARTDFTTITRALAESNARILPERLGGFGSAAGRTNSPLFAEAFEAHRYYRLATSTQVFAEDLCPILQQDAISRPRAIPSVERPGVPTVVPNP